MGILEMPFLLLFKVNFDGLISDLKSVVVLIDVSGIGTDSVNSSSCSFKSNSSGRRPYEITFRTTTPKPKRTKPKTTNLMIVE
jgi:hypothetical protein